ncbi:hypothetical protein RXV86_05970 [Alisedimentitalea sp. MJ-SS2]|uniref:hypothetical protein n=1 Tax=Aliisedimentitalea sp. MJ-SS2 TaxID=3049795 RepID=UPI00290B9C87|nr:hypothetical protein [Alisedimentitalea sp. MJ-SS2]MDU8926924.1 hypothetical protein [Alisedimentitalea sp. MJ-SS2]
MATIKLPLDPLVLSIGVGRENGPDPRVGETAIFLGYNLVDAEQIRRTQPDKVLSWLFCCAYDVYDIAQILIDAQFRGTYCAVAAHLPDAEAVSHEIRAQFPGLDFVLICPSSDLSDRATRYQRMIDEAASVLQLAAV